MTFNKESKQALINEIKDCLSPEKEIRKIVVFGSFLQTNDPGDIDLAVFQDSNEPYLVLAMKYRRLTRKVAEKIPVDVIPVRIGANDNWFLSEINSGRLIYEK